MVRKSAFGTLPPAICVITIPEESVGGTVDITTNPITAPTGNARADATARPINGPMSRLIMIATIDPAIIFRPRGNCLRLV